MNKLTRIPETLFVALIRLYQNAVSPWIGGSCRFEPTCSEYAVQALNKYGVIKGDDSQHLEDSEVQPLGRTRVRPAEMVRRTENQQGLTRKD